MNVDLFLASIEKKQPPALESDLRRLESAIGQRLPEDYRDFLAKCNGGYVGGSLWFTGPTPSGESADAGVHHIGGFRAESHLSLAWSRECYDGRIPFNLLWIMDDPFGNGICLGLSGTVRGQVYFWDHENEPEDDWDGSIARAGNVQLLANTFSGFVAGLHSPIHDA